MSPASMAVQSEFIIVKNKIVANAIFCFLIIFF